MPDPWYYRLMAEEVGPVAADELHSLLEAGRISDDTWVRKGLEGDWVLAGSVSALLASETIPAQERQFDPYHRWLGIPAKDHPPNHYRLLGIDLFEDDSEVIRDAADQRMAHVRTYQLGQRSELSQKILNQLAAARASLLDQTTKAEYDRRLRQVAAAVETPPAELPTQQASQPVAAPPRKRRIHGSPVALSIALGLLAVGVLLGLYIANKAFTHHAKESVEEEAREEGPVEKGDLGTERRAISEYMRGQGFAEKGDLRTAITCYSEAIRLKPDLADAYCKRGSAYEHIWPMQFEKAIADYGKAIELRPDLAEAYYLRGSAYYQCIEPEKGIADFSEALRDKCQRPRATFFVAT